jgi:hypothetical protein
LSAELRVICDARVIHRQHAEAMARTFVARRHAF